MSLKRAMVTLATGLLALTALAALIGDRRRHDDSAVAAQNGFQPDLRFATVGGVRLAYYERGTGPPLLMNMGAASTMSEWDPALLALLARERRLILYDYRGIGRSSRIRRSGLTIERLADDAAGLLDRLGVQRAEVLGWSLGGFVAQQIAIRHPERVSRLILAATNPGGSRTTFGPPAAQRIDSDPDASVRELLSVNFPPTTAGRMAARSYLRRVEQAVELGTVPDDFDVPASGYLAQIGAERRWYRNNESLGRLGSLRIPALIATGRRDVLTPPANSRLLASAVPGSQLELFGAAGHAFLFQEPGRFARLVGALGE